MFSSKPTLQSLVTRVQSDIASRIGISLPLKKASVLSAVSFALAGAIYLLYGSLEYWVTQWFIDTATGKNLERLAGFFGMQKRGKTQARGSVRIDGLSGKIILKDALLTRNDGMTYALASDVSLGPDGFAYAEVIATQLGSVGNLMGGSKLSLVSSVSDIKKDVTVLDQGILGGFEEEEDEDLRMRLLRRLRNPGQGGSKADYQHWAQEIPGVGNVWVTPQPKGVAIGVSFLTTDPDHPLPGIELGKKVENSLKIKKPLGTRVIYSPLEPLPVKFEVRIHSESFQQEPLEKALKLYFLRKVSPGEKISLSRIASIIDAVLKHSDFKIVSPTTDVVPNENQVGILSELKCSSIQTLGGLECSSFAS